MWTSVCQEYDILISLWNLTEHPSLGIGISPWPQVSAPLNLTPDLVHPKSWPFCSVWNWSGSELDHVGSLWRILAHTHFLLASVWQGGEPLFPMGKTGVFLLSFVCPAEFFYGERGKGEISFLPIFLLSIAKVDLPLFSTCHVSSSSFPLPGSGDCCWQPATPSVFCWWCISNRLD